MIFMNDEQIRTEINRLVAINAQKSAYTKSAQLKLDNWGLRLDELASEIKAIVPNNKARGRKVRHLVEEFQNVVDVAQPLRERVRLALCEVYNNTQRASQLDQELQDRQEAARMAEAKRRQREAQRQQHVANHPVAKILKQTMVEVEGRKMGQNPRRKYVAKGEKKTAEAPKGQRKGKKGKQSGGKKNKAQAA